MALPNDSILVTPGTGATVPTHLVSGKEYEVVMVANSQGRLKDGNAILTIALSESVAAPIALTWYKQRQWVVPTGTIFRPVRAMSSVTTAGTRTLIVVGKKLGTFDLSTNVFTDGGSVASPRHYSRMFAIVTTAMSAVADTVTVTYTNDVGTAGKTTAGLVIPASSLQRTAFEFSLDLVSGSTNWRDTGVKDVTAVSDTAAPTGVIEIWGFNPLLDAQGVANAMETVGFTDSVVDDTESIFILFFQAAVTAQQRTATIIGDIMS